MDLGAISDESCKYAENSSCTESPAPAKLSTEISLSSNDKDKPLEMNHDFLGSITGRDMAELDFEMAGVSAYDESKYADEILQKTIARTCEATDVSNKEKRVEINALSNLPQGDMDEQIRMGQMTPFGTTISNNLLGAFENDSPICRYLKSQSELQNTAKNNKKSRNIVEERLRKLKITLTPPKRKKMRKKKEKLGTRMKKGKKAFGSPGAAPSETNTINFEDPSGSEYCPSEEELSRESSPVDVVNAKKVTKRKRKRSDDEEWSSNDSNWESEGERKKSTKRKKKIVVDDGNEKDYELRIKAYERSSANNEFTFHDLNDEGNFKIPNDVWCNLFQYQRIGVQWLLELKEKECGGILCDEMGLGKTIQVVAYLSALYHSKQRIFHLPGVRGLGPVLVVCPATVLQQWVREFHVWFPQARVAIFHQSGSSQSGGKRKAEFLKEMYKSNAILITSYMGLLRRSKALTFLDWHYVILDEGHKIRNPNAMVTICAKQLKTPNRVILTGSPLQNNLEELWSLMDFVYPGMLGTLPVFNEKFSVPITQGGYVNASKSQVITAFSCATMLKDAISPYMLRRVKADVQSHVNLPEKSEQVLFCKLTDEQRRKYREYVDSRQVAEMIGRRATIFAGLINLRKICNHPDLFQGANETPQASDDDNDGEEADSSILKYAHWSKSGKMIVVDTLLKIWRKQGHRVLLFTQSRRMLLILESYLKSRAYMYLKMDGTTPISSRQALISKFNTNAAHFVMLLTTKVGGLGINLTGADRVVIYDPDWNPATDLQARERAWRIGQTKNVTIYRLITAGTIEEKIYHRQIFKQFLTNKILKDPKQKRFFKTNDLYELFAFDDDVDSNGNKTETGEIFAETGSEINLKKLSEKKKEKSNCPEEGIRFSKEKIEQMRRNARKLASKLSKTKGNKNTGEGVVEKEKAATADDEKVEENFGGFVKGVKHYYSEGTSARRKRPSESAEECVKSNEDAAAAGSGKVANILEGEEEEGVGKAENSVTILGNAERAANAEKNLEAGEKGKDVIGKLSGEAEQLPGNVAEEDRGGANEGRKKNKKRKTTTATVDGEFVPYLLKRKRNRWKADEDESASKSTTQDEYVLAKLFDKSGICSAMKHDEIVGCSGGGGSGSVDYILMEKEADAAAKNAIKALQNSSSLCFQAISGIPSWTGQCGYQSLINGARKYCSSASKDAPFSALKVLESIRKKNEKFAPTETERRILADVSAFISGFRWQKASTQELTDAFKHLPPSYTPFFKALLNNLCDFKREGEEKTGYWYLKEEFR